jgi:hypothetical protein
LNSRPPRCERSQILNLNHVISLLPILRHFHKYLEYSNPFHKQVRQFRNQNYCFINFCGHLVDLHLKICDLTNIGQSVQSFFWFALCYAKNQVMRIIRVHSALQRIYIHYITNGVVILKGIWCLAKCHLRESFTCSGLVQL